MEELLKQEAAADALAVNPDPIRSGERCHTASDAADLPEVPTGSFHGLIMAIRSVDFRPAETVTFLT
jgi:hypothetical protein